MEFCITCGREEWSCALLIADCDVQENLSASDGHVKRFKDHEVAQGAKLLFPCADGCLKLLDLPQPPRVEMPARRNSEQDHKGNDDTLVEKMANTLGERVVTSYIVITKYIESCLHRKNLSIPMMLVDVMKRSMSLDEASEPLNDHWNDRKSLLFRGMD